jgi:hypothetical protein
MRTPTLAVTTLLLLTASGAYAQQVSYYSYGVADDNNAYAWAVIDDGGMYGEIHTPGQSASLRIPPAELPASSPHSHSASIYLCHWRRRAAISQSPLTTRCTARTSGGSSTRYRAPTPSTCRRFFMSR